MNNEERILSVLESLQKQISSLEKTTNEKFEAMEKSTNRRFDTMENRFDTMENRLNTMEKSNDERFDALEELIAKEMCLAIEKYNFWQPKMQLPVLTILLH